MVANATGSSWTTMRSVSTATRKSSSTCKAEVEEPDAAGGCYFRAIGRCSRGIFPFWKDTRGI